MFENIKGQDAAVTQLRQALARPVNTYLFLGSRGTFVEEAARIFAARLIDPSGEIDERVSKSLYADVIEFEPMGTNYRVKEDVRESMLSESRKSPIEGSRKVLIVHDAHLLRADSANTLLKSLEEPPSNLFWILIAPSKDSLLATIRSRCYSVEFSRLSPEIIKEVLMLEGIDKSRAEEVSTMCSGRLDRARTLATYFAPLKVCARDIISDIDQSASFAATSAKKVVETFDEIASDVVATNKQKMDATKKAMKDSGYSDKIAQSIVSGTKSRLEAQEKRLRHELLSEFLEALYSRFTQKATARDGTENDRKRAISAGQKISQFRTRLVYNPSELLFLESLLASISLAEFQVNS